MQKKSSLSVWQTHTVGVDGIRSFGGNDIITFDKFGAIRKLGVIDGQLLTIQSHDVNELIYALDVAESGPMSARRSVQEVDESASKFCAFGSVEAMAATSSVGSESSWHASVASDNSAETELAAASAADVAQVAAASAIVRLAADRAPRWRIAASPSAPPCGRP